MCTIVEQISHKNWFTYILFLLVYLVKCDVIPRIFQLKLEMFYHYFFNHGRWLPKNRDVWQEGWKSCATFSAQRGETHCVTRALPDWTWELFKKKTLRMSTCILHDNITGAILMFCKVLNILNLVFFVMELTPPPQRPEPRVDAVSGRPGHLQYYDYRSKTPFEPVIIADFKNGCCGDSVWYYCS